MRFLKLDFAAIGPLLRRCGAVFIRRSFGGDHLYTAIFNEYLKGVLRSGGALECFIEGGRGRSGKLLPPKLGFMKCIVEAVEKGDVEDVWILPVSFGCVDVLLLIGGRWSGPHFSVGCCVGVPVVRWLRVPSRANGCAKACDGVGSGGRGLRAVR